jgi:hypothetical protein
MRRYGGTINCKLKRTWKARGCAGVVKMTACTSVQLSLSGNRARGTPAGKWRASYNLQRAITFGPWELGTLYKNEWP